VEIAFLRFCALKLAEGILIASSKNKDKEKAGKPVTSFTVELDSSKFTDEHDQ
jgi:hypothetical protein